MFGIGMSDARPMFLACRLASLQTSIALTRLSAMPNTTRTESINAIAAASSPAVGLGILELIPIIEAAISVLSACAGPETPEQFVAAHTNADGTYSHVGVARLRRQIRVEASKQGQELTRQQADAIAVNMFREGGKHGENLGSVLASEG